MTEQQKGPAETLYGKLESRRRPFLTRAQDVSRYTIPAMIVPDGHSGDSELYKPWQSHNARCVSGLASQLLITLIPPTRKFFRYTLSAEAKAQFAPDETGELEVALAAIESVILREIETIGLRASCFEAMRHLIVAGNALIHVGDTATRIFPLTQYTARRTPEGELLELVVKEMVEPTELPDEVRTSVVQETSMEPQARSIPVFTHIYKDASGSWETYQEARGVKFNIGSYGSVCPWLALRWTRIDGEDYGRGLGEEHVGDLMSCEGLSKSLVQMAAIASKVVYLVSPNGITDPKDLADADTGDFKTGRKDDVTALTLDKYPDFQVTAKVLEDVMQRLSLVFLLKTAIQRNAERVTAEEIRVMAQELEDTLGGVYTVLSRELQLPVVEIIHSRLSARGKLPKLPKDSVTPTIVTGIDALGRNHELSRLDALMTRLRDLFGPEAVGQFVKVGEYARRASAGLDVDPAGLIKTDEELAAEKAQASQMQLTQDLGPDVIKAVSAGSLAQQKQTAA